MSQKLPPLNTLRAFQIAAATLSFTETADQLFVTQAAISHQIKSLEEFLGKKLLGDAALARQRSSIEPDGSRQIN